MPKTRKEVEELKAGWACDPCWDIEETEGFEEFKEELRLFRYDFEDRQKKAELERLQRKAEAIGCTGNTTLASYVLGLESAMNGLHKEIHEIRDACRRGAGQPRQRVR